MLLLLKLARRFKRQTATFSKSSLGATAFIVSVTRRESCVSILGGQSLALVH